MGEPGLRSFSAQTGSASGEITCEFMRQAGDTEKYITFFLQKKPNGNGENRITRIETAAGAASPYTISGAETGSEYFVYAVVTDRAYAEAETVSVALSATCSAGQ